MCRHFGFLSIDVSVSGVRKAGNTVRNLSFFDTLCILPREGASTVKEKAIGKKINLRYFKDGSVSYSFFKKTFCLMHRSILI